MHKKQKTLICHAPDKYWEDGTFLTMRGYAMSKNELSHANQLLSPVNMQELRGRLGKKPDL